MKIVEILSGLVTKQLATILLYRAILQVGELWKNVLYCMDDYDTDMGAIIQIYMGIHTGESRRP